MGLYHLLDDGQAQACASCRAGAGAIGAIEANTFAHTASWSSLYSDSSLSSLMALLAAHRADAAAHDVVYAIVDDTMWNSMHLSIGSSFILPKFDGFNTHFIVAGRVHSIPGVYDAPNACESEANARMRRWNLWD